MNLQKLTDYLNSLEERYGIPASDCKIMKDHEVVFRHMTGYSDYNRSVKTAPDNLYRMYSATKLITNVAVLQLAECGKLNLYQQVSDFLPEFSYLRIAEDFEWGAFPPVYPDLNSKCRLARQPLRIIDLMTMTAGMSYDTEAEPIKNMISRSSGKAATRELVGVMAEMPLLADPGTRWSYSLAHDVLAGIIEEAAQMKFSDYLRQYIFAPLDTEDFYFHEEDHIKHRVAALYETEFFSDVITTCTEQQRMKFEFTNQYESGGAGLITSVDAYCEVTDALCNGGIGKNGTRILTEKSLQLLQTNYLTAPMLEDYKMTGKIGYGYGLGVRVLTDPNTAKSPVGEFGWDGAAGSYVLVDCKNHITIFYAQHVMSFIKSYHEIHPMIRDLAYEGLFQN